MTRTTKTTSVAESALASANARMAQAVADEREACAKLADDIYHDAPSRIHQMACEALAKAIRAEGKSGLRAVAAPDAYAEEQRSRAETAESALASANARIAQAVADERKLCAKLADDIYHDAPPRTYGHDKECDDWQEACEAIAEAIRDRTALAATRESACAA